MKTKTKKIFLLVGLASLALSITSCGSKSTNKLLFWGWADQDEAPVYQEIVDNFNNTVGKENGFTVEYKPLSTEGYTTLIEQTLGGRRGPDVFFVDDKYFKKWAKLNYLEPLDSYMSESTLNLDDIWSSAISRYRYNVSNNTSTDSAPLYGLPKDVSSTALYYNESALEEVGIKVISVDECDLDAFNNNEKQDNNGKFKSDYGITSKVLNKGFYRENQYVKDSGISFVLPQTDEVMIFNNRIPMNWDEIEDLSMILTKTYNPNSPTTYGFYTEWWFSYAFGIGGDCIEDTTGNGDWTFTLGDETSNYMVNTDVVINNTAYKKGDFVGYNDKLYLANESNTQALSELLSSDKLTELPSTREAFTRFVNISQKNAPYGETPICPMTKDVNSFGKPGYFSSENIAILCDYTYRIVALRRLIGEKFTWNVAPLPIYKKYTTDDCNDDTVSAIGTRASHSSSSCLSIWKNSPNKDKAFLFIDYMAGTNAQEVQASTGFNLPNEKSLAYSNVYLGDGSKCPKNIKVFAEAAEYQTPGDWWYMPDKTWTTEWATALNSSVRNGTMTLDTFFNKYIDVANKALKIYKE